MACIVQYFELISKKMHTDQLSEITYKINEAINETSMTYEINTDRFHENAKQSDRS